MSPPAPPEPAGAPTDRTGVPWTLAGIRGLVAFAIVAGAGLLPAVLTDLFGAGLSWRTTLRLGWLYALTFHRIGIEVTGGTFRYRLSVALLSGTALAAWILYREGRRAAAHAGGGPVMAALAGASIAPTYALAFLGVTLVLHLDLAGLPVLTGAVRIEGIAGQAFLFPLLLAGGSGAAGGLLRALPRGSLASVSLVGGWRTFVAAVGLALVGLLLVAALRPEGLATYARVVGGHGPKLAAYLLGHQALALPNIAVGVLVPSMGGCLGLHGAGFAVPVVCGGRLPRLDAVDLLGALGGAMSAGRPPALSRPMPVGYGLLVAVPLVATIWGGRRSAAVFRSRPERLAAGGWSGAVFGGLIGVVAWLAGVTIELGRSVTFGARPLPTGALAIAWGVAGGALGAALPRRQTPVPEPEPEPDPAPPSPTSV